MFVAPINPNGVEISTVPAGCCKTEFNSTYPVHLNGVITQDEFRQSITNINQSISNRKNLLIVGVLSAIFIIAGIALFIAGGITAVTSRSFGFPVLVAVGFGVFFLGMIVTVVGCIIIQVRFSTRLQQAITTESAKYSTRSIRPCSWRLQTSRYSTGGYNNRRTVTTNCIVIDIDNSGGNGTYQGYGQPLAFYGQSNNPSMPPPNSGYTMTGFCPRCGGPRQNPAARFCPSCGQPYNK